LSETETFYISAQLLKCFSRRFWRCSAAAVGVIIFLPALDLFIGIKKTSSP